MVIFDQWTKQLVLASFVFGESIPVIPGLLNFTFVKNPGAAFGLLADAPSAFVRPLFVVLPVFALAGILFLFSKLPSSGVRAPIALALLAGGAIGNLVDRALLGYVIDFLDFHWQSRYHFPAFNVADAAISVGVGILMLDLVLQERARNASVAA